MFDFDCNSSFTALSDRPRFDPRSYDEVDPWFTVAHPLHDQPLIQGTIGGAEGGGKKRSCGNPEQTASRVRENSSSSNNKKNKDHDESMASQLEAYRSRKSTVAGAKVGDKRAPLTDVTGKALGVANKKARVDHAAASEANRSKPIVKATASTAKTPVFATIPKATPLHKAPSSSSSAVTAKKANVVKKPSPAPAVDGLDDMEALLKQHNKKFQPKAQYEPSLHSVRAVRMWEKRSGRLWARLTTEERQAANADIAKLLVEGEGCR